MEQDPYREFAGVYDEWQKLYPRPFSLSLAPKIRQAVGAYGATVPVLADLACGTGTFASFWARTHPRWTVYGTDRSAAMIRRARAGAGVKSRAESAARSGPRFLVQDLNDLSLPRPAGVLTCLFDSLNHVTRTAALQQIFHKARAALAPGGLFLFDLIDENGFLGVFTGSSILRGADLFVAIETECSSKGKIDYGAARFTFFRRSGPRWRRIEFQIRERRWTGVEVRHLLEAAGLSCLRVLTLDPYESDEFIVPRTFWICRRP